MYGNKNFIPLQELRSLFEDYLHSLDDLQLEIDSPINHQLETILANTQNANFKIVHPLLIRSYRMPTVRYRDKPLLTIGLDIETDASNGNPKLLGFYYPTSGAYFHIYNPTLTDLFKVIHSAIDNGDRYNLITWGNLDIQCLLRLFKPTVDERELISRGISGNVKEGKFVGDPPIIRMITDPKLGEIPFYVSHYIPGRSLKLGYIHHDREYTIWVFNISQFYPGTIAQTAKGLRVSWTNFAKETHIIDWAKFGWHKVYRHLVLQSNHQDARVVQELCDILQQRFYDVFECYPTILVSTGSLCDAAVSKMLSDDKEDYSSNAWRWLCANVWGDNASVIQQADTLISEAYSAGYVDQYALGFFNKVWTADIASAYPHKIRSLPDLRHAKLSYGEGHLEDDLATTQNHGMTIESAFIRGLVNIPQSLRYHPITIKTYNRENTRPVGQFYAAYTLEERRFCERHGATFSEEQYVIVALTKYEVAPLARVSTMLGEYRDRVIADMKSEPNIDRKTMLDGQQYMIKIVDNSLYGKTVMTTEIVENIEGSPQIVGYMAGDRFNMLYGALITARTRVQIAEACNSIAQAGGVPIMTMTDSIYWYGNAEQMPGEMIRTEKTAGYFEAPEMVEDFYIIKTGQYEYRRGPKWTYKMRGLNVNYELLTGVKSFYRTLLKDHCSTLKSFMHPKDIAIPISTRRLISIGSHDLENLGAIQEGITQLRPFVMSSKQMENFVTNWRSCLDGHIWLDTFTIQPKVDKASKNYPLAFLKETYNGNVKSTQRRHQKVKNVRNYRHDQRKKTFARWAFLITNIIPPDGRYERESWEQLESHFGIQKDDPRFLAYQEQALAVQGS